MLEIFDSHFHIIDPRFPLIPNQAYLPSPFTSQDYIERVKHLNIKGGAVVSGSFQAFDQTYLLSSLKELGPAFVGVTQLPASVSDEEILSLNASGVRAVRFNLKRGGSEGLDKMEGFARRIHDLVGWHIELYVDSKDLADLSKILQRLPSVSIDHLGLSKAGFSDLLALIEKGIKVKATGFGRLDFDVRFALKEIVKANPDAMMFGTDLPSTRAPRPFLDKDIDLILDTFDQSLSHKILYSNAIEFYKPKENLRIGK